MRNTTKRSAAVAASATFCLVVAGAVAPGAVAAEKVDGDVDISNTETVSVLMGADGSIDSQRVYDQLVLSGRGKVDISNPVSTKGLRNLDGFGGWTVRDGAQRVDTDVNGEQKYRSVSDFDGKLPVSIDVKYTLNGKRVQPGDVVGERGELEVRYEVKNITGEQQEVTFTDGEGNEQTQMASVVIPLVGSMTTVLPSSFTEVRPDGANAAGDGRGGTQLSFTMTLFPPIGSDRATFGYTAKIEDGVVPKASLSLLPVNPLENTSFKGGAASYKGGADSGADLTAGAVTIDENLLKIRDGANDLVDGLVQLRDGANELNAGLAGKAAPGAQELAAGAGKLDAGANKLDAGASKLKTGTGDLKKGTAELSAGVNPSKDSEGLVVGTDKLAGGIDKLEAGLAKLRNDVSVGNETTGGRGLDNAIIPGVQGIIAQLAGNGTPENPGASAALTAIKQAIDGANGYVAQAAPNAQVQGGLTAASAGVASLKEKLDALQSPAGLPGLLAGLQGLSVAISNGVGVPSDGQEDSLAGGAAALSAGADGLKEAAPKLVEGIGKLNAGASKLKAGTGDLKDGTNQLSDGTGKLSTGAGTLSQGLGDAADGSGKLAAGLETAAESAPALPEGAQELSDKGTSQLVNVGNGTALDYGLKYALIEAGSARAASVQPYGAPEGATELTAYKFELASATGEGSANVGRGIALAVLAAAALGLAALRRRAIAG